MTGKRTVRLHGTQLMLTLGLLAVGPAWAEDKPGETPTALEQKLHGAWIGGGPCDGRITFQADGTYERRLHGPAGNNSSGAWKVRWDALPPTLVLTCKTSDDPAYAGKTLEVKLLQLDDADLVFQYQGQTPSRFTRNKKADPGTEGKGEKPTKDELLGEWQSVEVTLTGGQSNLDLKPDGKFIYEQFDVSTGWRTRVIGTWEFNSSRPILTAQQRSQEGKEVEVGKKKTEELSAKRRAGEWILIGSEGTELRKATKGKK